MVTDYAPIWHWVREREAIRVKREAGQPKPWTTDEILLDNRFCNVRREDDTVTVWIRKNIRKPFAKHEMLWFMLCIGRWINLPETLAELIIGQRNRELRVDPKKHIYESWPSHPDFRPDLMTEALGNIEERGATIFTGAYNINAPKEKGASKTKHVAETILGSVWAVRDRFNEYFAGASLKGTPNLQKTHEMLKTFPGWGDFMAYQAIVDMRFTGLLRHAEDIDRWAAAGPGTIRGLNRVHGRPLKFNLKQEQALSEMRAIFKLVKAETGVEVDFSDVPNIMCETDKYIRVKNGEGGTRQRYPGRA